jgi:hypothetical protein
MHDATKVLMGQTGSNIREVDNRPGDPATFVAGLALRLKSDDTLSVTSSDGALLGVSLGRSLSDTKRVAIARKGVRVPIIVASGVTPVVGSQVTISNSTGKAHSAGTAVNAVYVAVGLTGIDEDGNAIASDTVALIDFPGGL